MADFFEFEESDIIFSDDFSDTNQSCNCTHDSSLNSRSILCMSSFLKEVKNSSVPVNITGNSNFNSGSNNSSFGYDQIGFCGCFSDEFDGDDDDDDDDQIVPPHVIVDRRRSSDFDSYEKNAKVKNMFHVRDSILKLTGFVES